MADADDISCSHSVRKSCLFPSFDGSINREERQPLFLSVPSSCSEKKESLDWLHNESYQNVDTTRKGTTSKMSSDEEDVNIVSSDDENEGSSGRRYHKKKKDKRRKKHKHKKQRRNEKIREEEKLSKLPSTIWIEESGLDTENAFRVDRKPDADNISFGGLYRLDIALYNLNPTLSCLGQGSTYVVNLAKAKEKKKRDGKHDGRYWVNYDLLSSDSTLVTTRKRASGFSQNFSYVPLQLPSSGENTNAEMTLEDNESLPSIKFLAEVRLLNQQVRDDPGNIEAWLALADIQAKQVQQGKSSDSFSKAWLENHKKRHKLELEKKSTVLEQAVEKNPTSVDLVLAYMNVCMETLTSAEIGEKWRKMLFIQPQNIVFWKHYLLFCQANFSTFTFSKTLAIYSKCFATLSAIKDGSFKSHSPEENMEGKMLEIFMQFCQFLKQAGHIEKAVAAFQALVEINCFIPKSLGQDLSTVQTVSMFETFWDSDLPRFGEDNAEGWASSVEKQPLCNPIIISEIFGHDVNEAGKSTMAEQGDIMSAGLSKSATWVSLEMSRETEQWLPRKTSDENEDEDPDRVVLFQDISSCLFKISDDNLKFHLVCYFLIFLGVAVDTCCHVGSCLMQILLKDDLQLCHFDSKTGSRFSCSQTTKHSTVSGKCCRTPALRMFIRNIFNQALKVFSGEFQSMLVHHWLMFERDVLLTVPANTKQHKQQYKAVRKLSKSLLKLEQFCNDLRLWMVFVKIECSCGNIVEARRIVSSTLQQTFTVASFDPTVKAALYDFVRCYCEMEMRLHDSSPQEEGRATLFDEDIKNNILGVISFLVGTVSSLEAVVSPAQILKTQRTLQDMKTELLSDEHGWNEDWQDNHVHFVVDFIIAYALFAYWSLGIDTAATILDSMLSHMAAVEIRSGSKHHQLRSGSKYHQQVLVFYCRLLQFHSKHSVSPVRRLRHVLLSALETFPEESFFLHCYVTLELKSCIAINVRRFFDRMLPASCTPLPWLAAVMYETRRRDALLSRINETSPEELFCAHPKFCQSGAGTVFPMSGVANRVRSLFEKAIVHASCRHCVAVWRSYINFEIQNGDLHQAKAVFYRSLQSCAWAKVLYVDAARSFPDSLQDLHDLMEEKELRIRAPLEELALLETT